MPNKPALKHTTFLLCASFITLAACSAFVPKEAQAQGTPPAHPKAGSTKAVAAKSQSFSIPSVDGTLINGQVDFPANYAPEKPTEVVVMVHGTGFFDRDAKFGKSGAEADKLFLTLSKRLTDKGVTVVRFDRRGVNYGKTGKERITPQISGSTTVKTQWQDLQAVYGWALKTVNSKAKCFAIFGHSEGMANIGRLAEHERRAPALVVGMGGLLESPKTVFKWQLSGRDAFSLEKMDVNHDGITTNEEVEANWTQTPSAVFNTNEPFIHPEGQWTKDDIKAVLEAQGAYYEQAKTAAMAIEDAAPYPNAQRPMAQYSWWKHWYQDDTPITRHLQKWDSNFVFYNGDIDSQVRAERQQGLVDRDLKGRAVVHVLPGLGHSLGHHVLLGPMEESAAKALTNDIVHGLNTARR